MDYNVGSKVVVKKYLRVGKVYGGLAFMSQHKELAGKELVVEEVTKKTVKANGRVFTREMLVPVLQNKYKVGDVVQIAKGIKETREGVAVNNVMVKLSDEQAKMTIKHVFNTPYGFVYRGEGNGYAWEERMLEPVTEASEPKQPKVAFNVGDIAYTQDGTKVTLVERAFSCRLEDGSMITALESGLSTEAPLKEITLDELAKLGYKLKA